MAWKITKKIKTVFVILMIMILLGLIFIIYRTTTQGNAKYQLEINGKLISAEIAISPWQKYLGLSKRKSLCTNCAMLFIFPIPKEQNFVMRNMNFPLDIVFIANSKIINIETNVAPEGSKPTRVYRSSQAADMVLELPGNYCKQNEIMAGDLIIIKPN